MTQPICPAHAHLGKLLTLASNRKGTMAVQRNFIIIAST